MNLHAEPAGQIRQRFDDSIQPALNMPAAEGMLDVGDQQQSRRDSIWRRADIGRVALVHSAQARILEKMLDGAMIRAPGMAQREMPQRPQRGQIRRLRRSAAQKCLPRELENPRSQPHEGKKAGAFSRLDRFQSGQPFGKRRRMAKAETVVEHITGRWLDQRQLQVVFEALAQRFVELREDPGHRDQRRAGVEAKSGVAPAVHFSAERRIFLEQFHPPPRARQAQRGGDAAQSAADDRRLALAHAGRPPGSFVCRIPFVDRR
ncbi:MAG: hypothetical protein BWZ10_00115 [candidate division BRC1 bacterium ADurb.BinA364]|nr:MAG: hypothetical protein BWZ10_00115 [candidate division BRC1 bacterium ADurb.BinA364]